MKKKPGDWKKFWSSRSGFGFCRIQVRSGRFRVMPTFINILQDPGNYRGPITPLVLNINNFFDLLNGSVGLSLPSRQRLTDRFRFRFRCHSFASTSLPLPASLPWKSRAAIAVYASAASRCRVTGRYPLWRNLEIQNFFALGPLGGCYGHFKFWHFWHIFEWPYLGIYKW